MNNFEQTGVFSTTEEHQEILKAIEVYNSTPYIAFTTKHAMAGGLKEDEKERVHKLIHSVALSHGLPEINGYYGYNPDTLEFNKSI